MKQLERRVEPESREVKRRRWGVFESMALLGLVIVLSAIVGGIVWFIFRPQLRTAPSADNIRKSIESLPPQAVWREWHMMRTRGLNPNPIRQDPKYPDWYRRYRIGWGAILAIGVLGLALTVTMLSLRHRVGRARPPSSS